MTAVALIAGAGLQAFLISPYNFFSCCIYTTLVSFATFFFNFRTACLVILGMESQYENDDDDDYENDYDYENEDDDEYENEDNDDYENDDDYDYEKEKVIQT